MYLGERTGMIPGAKRGTPGYPLDPAILSVRPFTGPVCQPSEWGLEHHKGIP